ncbi:uncharacterized protein LOC141691354 [Apium graveolens]|uniref:uncharacterized protein LOC141691354 n=1 Tax=Apium graveolens TaxID=4045 RepID=UPI003D795FAB
MVRGRLRVQDASDVGPDPPNGVNKGTNKKCPNYDSADYEHFSIKVYHSGDFNETKTMCYMTFYLINVYGYLPGLFKNTENAPVVLDDEEVKEGETKKLDKDDKDAAKGFKKGKKHVYSEYPTTNIGESGLKKDVGESGLKENVNSHDVGRSGVKKDQAVSEEAHLREYCRGDYTDNMESEVDRSDYENNPWEEEYDVGNKQDVVDSDGETNPEWKDDGSSSESLFNSDEERMVVSSCDEADPQFPEFNEFTDMDDPQFKLGLLFNSGQVFRAAVRKHAIIHQRGVRLKMNLSDKIKWIGMEDCEWKCYERQQQRSTTIQIKRQNDKHTCTPIWDQKQVNSTWLTSQYEEEIRMNPIWLVAAFQLKVINDLKCNVSHSMVYRALTKAMEAVTGKHEEEFGKVYDHGNDILKVMPTSTIKIITEPAEFGLVGMRFKRM